MDIVIELSIREYRYRTAGNVPITELSLFEFLMDLCNDEAATAERIREERQ